MPLTMSRPPSARDSDERPIVRCDLQLLLQQQRLVSRAAVGRTSSCGYAELSNGQRTRTYERVGTRDAAASNHANHDRVQPIDQHVSARVFFERSEHAIDRRYRRSAEGRHGLRADTDIAADHG